MRSLAPQRHRAIIKSPSSSRPPQRVVSRRTGRGGLGMPSRSRARRSAGQAMARTPPVWPRSVATGPTTRFTRCGTRALSLISVRGCPRTHDVPVIAVQRRRKWQGQAGGGDMVMSPPQNGMSSSPPSSKPPAAGAVAAGFRSCRRSGAGASPPPFPEHRHVIGDDFGRVLIAPFLCPAICACADCLRCRPASLCAGIRRRSRRAS